MSQGIVETWSQTGSLLRLNYVPRMSLGAEEILNLGADEYHVLSSSLPGACPTCHVPRPVSSTLLVLPSTLPYQCLCLGTESLLGSGPAWPL